MGKPKLLEDAQTRAEFEMLLKLRRDLRAAAKTLTKDQARYLVDYYYQMQDQRIRAANQVRTSEEPNELINFFGENTRRLESNIKSAMGVYAQTFEVGKWSQGVKGIGPVLSAGLIAHIDMEKATTVGKIWRFAGLDATVKWKKGEKRPWNARLKTLCWKIGECFVKVSGHDDAYYGQLYKERKAREVKRNEAGEFADQAEQKLKDFKIGKDTDAYKAYSQGFLPPAHLHARATRATVKIFLAHWHEVAFFEHYKERAPKPYVIEHMGHANYLECPSWPF